MFDKDTLIITYDRARGEQRGSRKRSETGYHDRGLGDCIDCQMCVQVCPTGIDIRDGLQYECIACSACIDACDDVMDKMGYAQGLIRYDTEHGLEGKRTRFLRPRVLIYTAILLTLAAVFAVSLSLRITVGLDIIRDRNQLYRETDGGLIENVYVLKVINKDPVMRQFSITVTGIEGAQLIMNDEFVSVAAGGVLEVPVSVRVDEVNLRVRSSTISFTATARAENDLSVTSEARFLGPRR